MDGQGMPSEIMNIFRDSGERISNQLSESFAVQYAKCFEKYRTNMDGFEGCANDFKKQAEGISNRLEVLSIFANMRVSECMQHAKGRECVNIAQTVMEDIEKRILK